MPNLQKKYDRLREIIQNSAPLAIAFSGGVDSTLLLKAAAEVLPPDQLLAVTARAAIFPAWESREAADLVQTLRVEWLSLTVDVLAAPSVADNSPDRCYFCKKAIFQILRAEASKRGFSVLADGSNVGDLSDFRPGAKAALELGVLSPLKAADFNKEDIRTLSARLGLPTWNKPAYACLASRFPYGRRLTVEDLGRVEKAENILRNLGFAEARVRCHGEVARLEIGSKDFSHFLNEELLALVNRNIRALGFPFVALDLAPYRRGSLNETLDGQILEKYAQ